MDRQPTRPTRPAEDHQTPVPSRGRQHGIRRSRLRANDRVARGPIRVRPGDDPLARAGGVQALCPGRWAIPATGGLDRHPDELYPAPGLYGGIGPIVWPSDLELEDRLEWPRASARCWSARRSTPASSVSAAVRPGGAGGSGTGRAGSRTPAASTSPPWPSALPNSKTPRPIGRRGARKASGCGLRSQVSVPTSAPWWT